MKEHLHICIWHTLSGMHVIRSCCIIIKSLSKFLFNCIYDAKNECCEMSKNKDVRHFIPNNLNVISTTEC